MKVNELLTEAEYVDHTDTIVKAIEAAMVRHARLMNLNVDREDMQFDIVYEFPEHRTGLGAEVKKILKGIATVSVEKHTPYHGEFVLSFGLDFKEGIDNLGVEDAIRKKFKGSIE